MALDIIAKAAGVSTATVSRVINDQPGVSPARARQIRALIKKMNFEPTTRRRNITVAVNAHQLKGLTFAVIAIGRGYQMHTGLFMRMLDGISSASAQQGMNMMLLTLPEPNVNLLPPAILHRQVCGVLLAGSFDDQRLLAVLEKMPVIWLTSHSDLATGDKVLAGNEAAGECAARYLLKHNHARLCFWNPFPDVAVFQHRQTGFFRTARQAGADVQLLTTDTTRGVDLNDVPLNDLGPLMMPMVEQFAAMKPQPRGLFVPSDILTAELYPLLLRMGIRPGRDLTVISCDNEQAYLAGLDPRPASIDLGMRTIGQHAVEQLARRLRYSEEHARQVTLSVEPLLIES
ncbi:MAG: LacI family DNA-binding transcriptional regulator [Phycisphaeraceae bacterium]|nr:LacI family DNA-binding transcriptional regulator [Phycisphaeraceae bacterium]